MSLARLRRLSGERRRLLFEAGVLLCAATLGLGLLGYRGTRDRLDRWARSRAGGGQGEDTIAPAADLAWAVNAVAPRLPHRPSCLPRALALHTMLERRGIEAEIQVGVRRVAGAISGHAWVEVDGKRLGDPPSAEGLHRPLL